jgi:8-oxo-dGTP pyrophosphatase MutT (NUDIX family)
MKSTKQYSLVFPRRELDGKRSVLLGRKKRGFGEGKWNGFGGKIEVGETHQEGAVRELMEESGLKCEPSGLKHCGSLIFNMHDKVMNVEVYELWAWEGVPSETDEMAPHWFDEEQVLNSLLTSSEMWPDDKFWLPLLLSGLEGKKIRGDFTYAEDDLTITRNEVGIH